MTQFLYKKFKDSMTILKIPTPLRYYTDGQAEVTVNGPDVATAMRSLVEQYPTLEQHLYNGHGDLRNFVNLFLGENNIKDLQGLETPLNEGDTLRLIPSIAGGSNGSNDFPGTARRGRCSRSLRRHTCSPD
jgi:sulfur-carrier protein